MTITLLMIGKTADAYIDEGFSKFIERLKHYAKVNIRIIPDMKERKNLSSDQVMEKEADLILSHLPGGAVSVLLDEHGKAYRSVEFAAFLQKIMNSGSRELVFVVGGAYGVAARVKQQVHHQLSLSKMTFTHQFIRLMLAEQLYRAMTILKNEPYHNE